MRQNLLCAAGIAALLQPLTAAAVMTPGLYEYTVKMNIPGGPASIPAQTFQRCLGAKDLEGSKSYEMPPSPGSDCKVRDMNQSGSQFSYKMSCTKPQKMDATVQGSLTDTGLTMDMTLTMDGIPGPMSQAITAKRISDCKQ